MPATDTEARYAWRKRPRKFAPKSRKGCKTCKIRHIKCDLSEPHCQKCVSTGRRCDGYNLPKTTPNDAVDVAVKGAHQVEKICISRDSGRQNQECRPTQNAAPKRRRLSVPVRNRPCPSPNPLLVLPLANAREWHSLQFFEFRTLPKLNDCRTSTSWNHTLMFFSQTILCVRHAAIALGTIHKTFTHDPDRVSKLRTPHHSDDSDDTSREEFAFYHYNVAIRSLLRSSGRSSNPLTNTAVTLLVCYLFTCIENLSGSHMQAFKHLRSGIRLLAETHEKLQEARLESIFPSCYGLMQHITEQFIRLDRQAVTFLTDWLPQLSPDSRMRNCHSAVGDIETPKYLNFHSLDQAADMLQNLITRTLTLRRWDELYRNPDEDLKTCLPTARGVERRNQLLCQLDEWSSDFVALASTIEDMGDADRRLVNMLRLHHVMAHLFLSAYTCDGEMSYDAFMPQFETAVSLAAALVDVTTTVVDPNEKHNVSPADAFPSIDSREPSFTLEMGIIPTLYLAGLKCRDPTLRRQILRLLRHTRRRETVWDSHATACVLQRVMEIEEGGKVGEAGNAKIETTPADIPLERRIAATHWTPMCTGPACFVMFVLCSGNPEKRVISEVLDI